MLINYYFDHVIIFSLLIYCYSFVVDNQTISLLYYYYINTVNDKIRE